MLHRLSYPQTNYVRSVLQIEFARQSAQTAPVFLFPSGRCHLRAVALCRSFVLRSLSAANAQCESIDSNFSRFSGQCRNPDSLRSFPFGGTRRNRRPKVQLPSLAVPLHPRLWSPPDSIGSAVLPALGILCPISAIRVAQTVPVFKQPPYRKET